MVLPLLGVGAHEAVSGGAENPEILRRAPSSPVCAEPCDPAARFSQTAQCAVRVRCRCPIRGRAATPCGKSGAAGARRRCGCAARPGRSVALSSFYTPAWTGQPQRSARAALRAADVVQRMRTAGRIVSDTPLASAVLAARRSPGFRSVLGVSCEKELCNHF
ncbi:hypothetical protein mRhiFer1_008786 [Rhinolophus ferrumequinum]|uniref:Uncharacterized protein n=1 Tax=Rhinolophus ferrumequinum TaxID=59479 RepID=A0A7J7TMB3_RHIFE|nr:hypothetical protein mRhiFer1_008786 [Rhinolophus ferrumequinum]